MLPTNPANEPQPSMPTAIVQRPDARWSSLRDHIR
jgi:hypothetical protein